MANSELKRCPNCSIGKDRFTHTYATYKVYEWNNKIKIVCKTCDWEQTYKIVKINKLKIFGDRNLK